MHQEKRREFTGRILLGYPRKECFRGPVLPGLRWGGCSWAGVSRAHLMVFQLDDVNQYLTICPDKGIFLLIIPFDCDAGRRVSFQKLINW